MAQRLLCALGGLSISVAAIYPVVNKPKSIRPSNETEKNKLKVNEAIKESRKLINRLKNEVGAPGIVVGVSIDGEEVWKEGLGYADLENEVEANEETVMRIASISKSLTAAVVARLWQDGVIDIDKPVQTYVPTFPEKKFGNEKVTITTRHLMCHLSGIRHYSKKRKEDEAGSGDGQHEEFYSKERYDSVEKALSIFKDDELLYAPGSKYLYTTYGWTLVSAVMEGATGKTYPQIMRAFLRELGMRRTCLDQHEPIIYGRSKCYSKNKNGRVVNSPYMDNSCKWAGGGFLSTVGDLLKFSNALLFAFQRDGDVEIAKDSYKMIQQKSLNSENALAMKNETVTTNDSNLQQSTSVIGYQEASNTSGVGSIASGVGRIASGVMYGAKSVWSYGSSWLSKDENDSKAVGENKASESNETDKDSKSVLQKTTSVIGSGVDSDSKAVRKNKANESAETDKNSKSVLQRTSSIIGSGVVMGASGVIYGASSVMSNISSWLSRDESDSKAVSDSNANESAETDKDSKSVLQKTTSVIGSGVDSDSKAVRENKANESAETDKDSKSVLQRTSSIIGSGVDSDSKAVRENKANESAETDKDSKSVLQRTSSIIGSGVDSDSKAVCENKANESAETDKDSKSVLQRTSSIIGSGVVRGASGVMYGAKSVWSYGSSWLSKDESDSKAVSDNNANESAETDKDSKSVLQKTTSVIGSGVDSDSKAVHENKANESAETDKDSKSVLQRTSSIIGSGVVRGASGVMYGAKSVWSYGSSWLSKDESDSKAVSDSNANESAETDKDSKSVLQKTTSVIGSGVDSDSKAVRENKANESAETDKDSKSVLQRTSSIIGSGVVRGASGVMYGAKSVWSYGSSWLSKDESDSKAVSDSNANESAETDKDSKSVLQRTSSVIGTGFDSVASGVTSGISSVWNYGSSLLSRDKSDNNSEIEKDSKSVLQKTSSVIGSGVDSVASGVTSGISSVWNYGSSLLSRDKSDNNSEIEKDSKSVLQKTSSVIGSGVDSVASGVTYGISSVWNYGSSLLSRDKSDNNSDIDKDSKSVLQKTSSVIGSGVDSVASGVMYGASSVWNYGSSLLSRDKSDNNSDIDKDSKSVLQKTSSVIGSGVDSVSSGVMYGASSVWKYGSSLLSRDKSDNNSDIDKNSKSVLQKTSSVIGSGVDSVASGVMYGASSVWKYGSSLLSKEGSDNKAKTDNDKEKSILSSLSSWFKPKALSETKVVRTSLENDKELTVPEASLTGVFFWNGIVIPYAVGAIRGQLSSRVFSQSEEEELKESVKESMEDQFTSESSSYGIDSPFFSKTFDRAPYILPTTVAKLWTRVDGTLLSDWGPHVQGGYGLGFGVASPIDSAGGVLDGGQPYIIGHTGGAVGASSAMVIVPRKCNNEDPPKGIAVVLLCNMQSVSLNPVAIDIAKLFSRV